MRDLVRVARQLSEHLHTELRAEWEKLAGWQDGELPPLDVTYRAAPMPENLRGRRVELIVEASDTAAVQQALQLGVEALVIDFDDTFSPTHANLRKADTNLKLALMSDVPVLVRPRALYAVEEHFDFDAGGRGIASLGDLSAALTAHPTKIPHLYVPKLETVSQAQFWGKTLALAEQFLNLPPNSVRVCLQIETFPGLVNADHLLFALHKRAYGLNAGRWDYVFSLLKNTTSERKLPVPPRSALTMDVPAMQAYAQKIVQVCQQRGAEAIGGTAAIAPTPQALEAVKLDKEREAAQGFTAAWAGLPELIAPARAGLESVQQAHIRIERVTIAELTDLPELNVLPLHEFRDALGLALDVFQAWFEGRGVIARKGRIEDTATAELARTQVWQWVRCAAQLDDGKTLTTQRYLKERKTLAPDESPAANLMDALVISETCPAYFPRVAQLLHSKKDSEA